MLNNVCIRKYSNRYFTNLSAVMYILLFSESPQHLIKVKIVQQYFFFFAPDPLSAIYIVFR